MIVITHKKRVELLTILTVATYKKWKLNEDSNSNSISEMNGNTGDSNIMTDKCMEIMKTDKNNQKIER